MTIINESGLYSLILTSRKPAANRLDDDEKADVGITDPSRKPAANLWDSKRSTRQPLTMHHDFKKAA